MSIKSSLFFILAGATLSLNAQVFKENGFIIDKTTGKEYELTTQQSYDQSEDVVLQATNYWLGLEECPYEYGTLYMKPFIAQWVKGNKKYAFQGEEQIWNLFKSDDDFYSKAMYFASLVKVAIEYNLTQEAAINEKAREFFVNYALNKKYKLKLNRNQKKALKEMKENL